MLLTVTTAAERQGLVKGRNRDGKSHPVSTSGR
jgi:hypothetical protein